MIRLLLGFTFLLSAVRSIPGQARFVVDTVASDFPVPKRVSFLAPDTALVVWDRFRLSMLTLPGAHVFALEGGPAPVPVRTSAAETGILDVLPHPEFTRTRVLYISTAVGTSERTSLAVLRGRVMGRRLVDTTTLLHVAAWDTSEAHYGGRLAWRDGYLYVSVGERESRLEVPRLDSHKGKILRIHDDGRIPVDNPFVATAGAMPEIWSRGHRNPQGLAFDGAGILWSTEHGPRHGDEVNQIVRGADYGWPRVSFGHEYTGGAVGSGFTTDSLATAPVWVWTPGIAPSDLLVYRGPAFPALVGNLLTTSLNNRRHLNRLVLDGGRVVLEERLFSQVIGRARSITQDHRGWLYVGNDAGQILRIRPGGSGGEG